MTATYPSRIPHWIFRAKPVQYYSQLQDCKLDFEVS